jgi:hypothetical protein
MKTELKEIKADTNMIAFCGLYCGACNAYLKGKCPGCRDNVKATWCKIRQCCMENHLQSCADCKETSLEACKKYTNFMSNMIGFILNSDRKACIERIRTEGYDVYAKEMTEARRQTIRRK